MSRINSAERLVVVGSAWNVLGRDRPLMACVSSRRIRPLAMLRTAFPTAVLNLRLQRIP